MNIKDEQRPAQSMNQLFGELFKKSFNDSVIAIEYCRSVCARYGFTVKQEASANKNIYVYCSREGLPDSQRNPKPSPQRKRPSKRCDCRWRVVLSRTEEKKWEFRKSMNPNSSHHNHEMMLPEEMVRTWPSQVFELITELARQQLQTHEIREVVKQRFPEISWNERRFYNRLTEERKRIKQRNVVQRSQRLLLLSSRLCSIVAANAEWTSCIESELEQQLEKFCQLGHITPRNLNTIVDINTDLIQMETDVKAPLNSYDMDQAESPTKKRRITAKKSNINYTEPQKGIQPVYVPSYTLQIRSELTHTPLESLVNSNMEFPFQENNSSFGANSSYIPLSSPTSTLSSFSSISFQQHPFTKFSKSNEMNGQPNMIQEYKTVKSEAEYQTQCSYPPYALPTSNLISPEIMYLLEQPPNAQKQQTKPTLLEYCPDDYQVIPMHSSNNTIPIIGTNENIGQDHWN